MEWKLLPLRVLREHERVLLTLVMCGRVSDPAEPSEAPLDFYQGIDDPLLANDFAALGTAAI